MRFKKTIIFVKTDNMYTYLSIYGVYIYIYIYLATSIPQGPVAVLKGGV